MSRCVSRLVAVLLALTLTLAAPSAFAARSDRGDDHGWGSQIVHFLEYVAHKFGLTTHTDVPSPPKP